MLTSIRTRDEVRTEGGRTYIIEARYSEGIHLQEMSQGVMVIGLGRNILIPWSNIVQANY